MKRDISVAELCRREGILLAAYYSWTNDFMEGGKAQLQRDARCHADSSGVEKLKRENATLRDLEIAPSTYYGWKRRMKARGVKAFITESAGRGEAYRTSFCVNARSRLYAARSELPCFLFYWP